MAKTYGTEYEPLEACVIDDDTLQSIGRLVRAFAEIEDIITLYIIDLAEISEAKAIIMLGRMPITRRLDIAKTLAHVTGEKITKLHEKLFNPMFFDVLACRNDVTHGTLMGRTGEGRLAFLTSKTDPQIDGKLHQDVSTYTPHDIKGLAKAAEDAVPILETQLKLQASRQERLDKPLVPHRKGRKKRKTKAKPKNQP